MANLRSTRSLGPGDVVEVRPAAEILATLDDGTSLDGMPFMPEMLKYVGRRFTAARRVEKICDTAGFRGTPASRRMRRTVLLDDLRCDGSAHDGCQAGCRLYWKEEWLRRVDGGSEEQMANASELAALRAASQAATTRTRELDGVQVQTYRCQATEAPAASEPLGRYDVRQYVREVTSGNVAFLHLVRVLGGAVLAKALRMLRLRPRQAMPSNGKSNGSFGALDLRPGDVVQVRSPAEIASTLDIAGKNRGLWFDDLEMIRYCGGTYRVRDRVERFIDDRTGRMVELSTDCVILDGVVCSGECSRWRWFCPRGIYPFWREAWLRRVEENAPSLAER